MTDKKLNWVPKDERKKILLLSDDLRMQSGVGTQSKELVCSTAHHFKWIQVAAAVRHPEQGKMFDMSDAVNQEAKIDDAWVRLYPYSGYGDPDFLRWLISNEKPDAILHFTDPRFWGWLYQIAPEIRQSIPIFYWHLWDDTPYPRYNRPFYESCDAILAISKQSYNIVKQVVGPENIARIGDAPNGRLMLGYIPHGVSPDEFKPLPKDDPAVIEMRKKMFGDEQVDFVVMWNNRNIRRKKPGDVILAYKHFVEQLGPEKAHRCRLVMHTQPVDENGTDIPAVIRDCAPNIRVVFSVERLSPQQLNVLYNCGDVAINLAEAEGFGLFTLEAMTAGLPISVNVTGGLQDQCGFKDEGVYLNPETHFTAEFGSNADGRYREHGEWVIPCFPTHRALIGSPATPYIYADHCDQNEMGMAMLTYYQMGRDERVRRGALGRQFVIEQGFSSNDLSQQMIQQLDFAFAHWQKPPRFVLKKAI